MVLLRKGFDDVGFRQAEVRLAQEAAKRRPQGAGFIVPFLLESCEIPGWCEPLNVGAGNPPSTFSYLLRAIERHCKVELPPLRFESCYLSYSVRDEKLGERIAADLSDAGVPCWEWKLSLRPGADIWDSVTEAIHNQNRFILFASENALTSPFVIREIRRALDREDELYRATKREQQFIVPVNLDDFVFDWEHSLRADLTRRVMINERQWQEDSGYIRIREKLLFDVLVQTAQPSVSHSVGIQPEHIPNIDG